MSDIIIGSAALLMLLLGGVTWWSHRRFKRQVAALKLLFKEQQRQIANLKTELHEIRCGSLGVGTRVQEVEGKLAQAIERQDEIQSQCQYHDPQSRLYSHAM